MPNDRVTNYSKLFILHGNLVEIVFVWKRIVLALSPIKEASEGNQYWNLVAGIRGLLGYEWECSLEHSWREGNYRADHLAKLGKSLASGITVFKNPPHRRWKRLSARMFAEWQYLV